MVGLEQQASRGGRFLPSSSQQHAAEHQQSALGGRARRELPWGRVLAMAGMDFGARRLQSQGAWLCCIQANMTSHHPLLIAGLKLAK